MRHSPGLLIALALTLPFSQISAESLTVAQECPQWVDARKQKTEQTTLYWLQGFIAAYNKYEYTGKHKEGVLKSSDPKVIAKWMDDYCQSNPTSNSQEAIESLIEERKPAQKACPVKKSSGRPCIPYEEKEESKTEEEPKKKNKWLIW
tara:strand:- start:102673 stop:103116 length:444 start_codon:yes stop_codon:yes gene_type:complete